MIYGIGFAMARKSDDLRFTIGEEEVGDSFVQKEEKCSSELETSEVTAVPESDSPGEGSSPYESALEALREAYGDLTAKLHSPILLEHLLSSKLLTEVEYETANFKSKEPPYEKNTEVLSEMRRRTQKEIMQFCQLLFTYNQSNCGRILLAALTNHGVDVSSIAQPSPKPPVIRSSSPKYYPEMRDLNSRFLTLVREVIGLGSRVEDLKTICIQLLNDITSTKRNVQEDISDLKKCSDGDYIAHLEPYWDHLHCDLLYQLIRQLQKPELMADWERYKVEVKEACKVTLADARRSLPQRRELPVHQISVGFQTDQSWHDVTIQKILDLRDFLKKMMGLEEADFEGFDNVDVTLFYTVNRIRLPFLVRLFALHRRSLQEFSITVVFVPGEFIYNVTTDQEFAYPKKEREKWKADVARLKRENATLHKALEQDRQANTAMQGPSQDVLPPSDTVKGEEDDVEKEKLRAQVEDLQKQLKEKVSSDVGNVCAVEDLGALAHEAELEKLCWIPFGIQTLTVGGEGGLFPLQPQTTEVYKDNDVIALAIPEGAVNTAVCDKLCIRYGVIVFGPFDLPEGYQLGSMAVYIYFNQDHAVKPVVLHLPHWSGKDGESGLKCVVASHRLEEGEEKYKFKVVKEEDFQSREGRRFITIEGHCSVFAKAFEDGFGANYLATSLIQKSEKDLRAVTNITVTYSSPVWIEIFMKHRKGFKVDIQRLFSFESEDAGVKMKLVEAQGPGWEAIVSGHLLPKDIQYETYKIKSPKQLKQAVINELYPPCLTCKATSSREAKESGKHKDVKVILEGTDRSTDCMVFTCPAFEERLTERDAPIGMNSPPHLVLSAPKHMTGPAFFIDGTPSVSPTSSGPQSLLTNRPSKELRVQHLMPYLTDLAACGLEIAGYLGLSTVWASIEISLKDPPGRLQELLTKWLDDSEQETSPHTWEFFVDVVRKVGKGKVADRIVHEIFTEPQDNPPSSVESGLDRSPQTLPSQAPTEVEENGH